MFTANQLEIIRLARALRIATARDEYDRLKPIAVKTRDEAIAFLNAAATLKNA